MAFVDGYGNPVDSGVNPLDMPIVTGFLPSVYITTDIAMSGLSDSKTNAHIQFVDGEKKFELCAKIKVQGATSAGKQKKNINATLYTDDTYDSKRELRFNSWPEMSKFHLKANQQDLLLCRNSVGANLTKKWMGLTLPKGAMGYIDSFPIILYWNGEWMGCYTWNIPQCDELFNFSEENQLACKEMCFRCDPTYYAWTDAQAWEYKADADVTDDMNTAFANLLAIMVDTDNLTKEVVEAHFDLDSLLAYIAILDALYLADSDVNNWTIATWDGVKWYHIYYDLDNCCYGREIFVGVQVVGRNRNAFFTKVCELYPDELNAMYAKLRNNGMDTETIISAFDDFRKHWGWQNIEAETAKWAADKPQNTDADGDMAMVKSTMTARFATFDKQYGYTAE